MHFFEDLTHFDGKFFHTMNPLLFKPGFLSEEYMRGRRASYLNPIRMYLFTSAIFFFILMTFFLKDESLVADHSKAYKTAQVQAGSSATTGRRSATPTFHHNDHTYNLGGTWDLTLKQYDSIQQALPPAQRDNFISHHFARRACATFDYIGDHPDTYPDQINEKMKHSFSQMFFVSLPFFALVLNLFYKRNREYNFVSHAIFSIHCYCAILIGLFFVLLTAKIPFAGDILSPAILLALVGYLFLAMKRFYKRSVFGTGVRFVAVNIMSAAFMFVLLLGYVVNSFLSLATN
jgi:hypothetical protein